MKQGDWVILKGKTRHGKNRVNQHGEKWLVEIVKESEVMLRSENKTFNKNTEFDGRWVKINDDPNFEMKEVK